MFYATLTLFEIQGDDNASLLFEFMGNPDVTNAEWADVKIGTENSGRNIVGNTENGKDYNAVGPYLLQLYTYFKGLYTPYGKSGVLGQPYIRPIIIKP